MIKEAIDCLLKLNDPATIDVTTPSGVCLEFVKDGYKAPPINEAATLPMETLQGFVDFTVLPEHSETEGLFVLVGADASVTLLAKPNEINKNRPALAQLRCPQPHPVTCLGDVSSEWRASIDMIPELQAGFLNTEDLRDVLKLLGNVTAGAAATYADDGVSQLVTVKAGITKTGSADVPNIVHLIPHATYPECVDSGQDYVLRARGGNDEEQPSWKLYRIEDRLFDMKRQAKIAVWLLEAFEALGFEIPVF